MFLPHPDFPREGAATCVAPPSNHWTLLLKKNPFQRPPPRTPALPPSPNAPLAKTSRGSLRRQRRSARLLMAALKMRRWRTRSQRRKWQKKINYQTMQMWRWTPHRLHQKSPHQKLSSASPHQTACPQNMPWIQSRLPTGRLSRSR